MPEVKSSPVKSGGPIGPIDRWIVLGQAPGVAPPGVEPLRALLNTDDRFHGVDTLEAEAPAAYVHLRDALRTLLVDGDARPLAGIADALPLRLVVEQGRVHLAPVAAAGPVDAAVAGLLARFAEAQNVGEWSRLKACGNPDCQWVFYDTSRNRSGRWCSMQECGGVMKARAYRRRQRTADGGEAPR
ncbi:CGNR zinc finger domain-containing protein [Arthrobacter sp. JSM 101049]|uniref:CGNR zinc finger domain-containing protein n=1 Tax=Arthrobacter sp. JSM 101049 TaxID=929097 RepID=UPI00356A5531